MTKNPERMTTTCEYVSITMVLGCFALIIGSVRNNVLVSCFLLPPFLQLVSSPLSDNDVHTSSFSYPTHLVLALGTC